jgi:hypothetical protein
LFRNNFEEEREEATIILDVQKENNELNDDVQKKLDWQFSLMRIMRILRSEKEINWI